MNLSPKLYLIGKDLCQHANTLTTGVRVGGGVGDVHVALFVDCQCMGAAACIRFDEIHSKGREYSEVRRAKLIVYVGNSIQGRRRQ